MNAVDPALHRGERAVRPLSPREMAMAEAIREIVGRDGHVTEAALLGEGFTAAEIVEFYPDAERAARCAMTAGGTLGDRVPEIIGKALAGQFRGMPQLAATPQTGAMIIAWRGYCVSLAAHKLDPWLSQSARCLARLQAFLDLLPLLPAEKNRVINGVAPALRRGRLATWAGEPA